MESIPRSILEALNLVLKRRQPIPRARSLCLRRPGFTLGLHYLNILITVKIPAPDRFGWPYADSCIGKRFASELQLLKLSFIFNANGSIPELTNLFPVYESCF
ncbi:hypothetical protein V6N11_001965 [Hibiscus sabdariffa]|uniref:Uncharacterized protein n=1 Tax=Hibiscus sabdariffa TaxID=183260 RepID=A0ABR2QTZ1_9ROSI